MTELLVLNEVFWWIFFVLFYGSGAWVVSRIAVALPLPGPVGLVVALPFGALTVIAEAGFLRALSGRLKPGVYPKSDGKTHSTWGFHFLLSRLVFLGPMQEFIQYSPLLRWAAWNALGARVSFRSMLSSDLVIPDLSLITVGRGSLIGSRTRLSPHVLLGDRLELGAITLGERVVVGGECQIGPGTEIGDGAVLTFGVSVAGNAVIGEKAFIGKLSKLGDGVRIGAGAVVETDSKVPNGTVIPPGATWRHPKEERARGFLDLSTAEAEPVPFADGNDGGEA